MGQQFSNTNQFAQLFQFTHIEFLLTLPPKVNRDFT